MNIANEIANEIALFTQKVSRLRAMNSKIVKNNHSLKTFEKITKLP